jgi:hypothetical protein
MTPILRAKTAFQCVFFAFGLPSLAVGLPSFAFGLPSLVVGLLSFAFGLLSFAFRLLSFIVGLTSFDFRLLSFTAGLKSFAVRLPSFTFGQQSFDLGQTFIFDRLTLVIGCCQRQVVCCRTFSDKCCTEKDNVSPKHCVGDSRLASVYGWKWENRLNRGDHG